MFKKLNPREAIAVTLLLVFLVGYAFITWVYDPMTVKKEELINDKDMLETEVMRKNIKNLEDKKQELEDQSKDVEVKLSEIQTKRQFGPVDYQTLITYLGKEADNLKIDVVQFRKLPFENQNVYWEIPYEVSIQGNYDNIILFMNSLYKLDKYFYVTGMDLREVSRIPMSNKVVSGDEKLAEKIKFDWANEFIDKLDKTIPSEIKKEDEQEFMTDFANEMKDAVAKKTEEKTFSIEEKLQLKFVFHFVSLEDPNKMTSIEPINE